MGKRKRSTAADDHNKTKIPSSPSDVPSRTEFQSREKSSRLLDASESKPVSLGMDVKISTAKLLNTQSSLAHQHHNICRSFFLKRSRHYYSHHYSRRNSGSHASASTSHGKAAPLCDERLPFKLTSNTCSGAQRHTETWEKAFSRPERIKFSSLVEGTVSSDAVKMVCGICQKLLRRKPFCLGETMSSGEFSVVAVLVCGHVYHADCLKQRTVVEDTSDPPCPLCLGLLSQVDASREEE